MENEILGVCPTCYLVVRDNDLKVSLVGAGEATYWHRECEPSRMKFMRNNATRWEEDGQYCKKMREDNDFTASELAEALGVSETKLRKFEQGKPVTHARLLSLAIIRFFQLFELQLQKK